MWIGLLTSGAHPERPAASAPVATLFVWDRRHRARVDGPERGVGNGMRMLRGGGRGLGPPAEPRCFVCRAPYPIPDAAAIRAQEDIPVHGAHVAARGEVEEDTRGGFDAEPGAGGGVGAGGAAGAAGAAGAGGAAGAAGAAGAIGEEVNAGDGPGSEADAAGTTGASGPAPGGSPGSERSAVFALVHLEDHRPIGREGEALVHLPGTQVVSLVPFAALDAFVSILGDVGYELPRCARCGTLAPGGSLADVGMPGRSAPARTARRHRRRRAA